MEEGGAFGGRIVDGVVDVDVDIVFGVSVVFIVDERA